MISHTAFPCTVTFQQFVKFYILTKFYPSCGADIKVEFMELLLFNHILVCVKFYRDKETKLNIY